jgi:hypothetical protein
MILWSGAERAAYSVEEASAVAGDGGPSLSSPCFLKPVDSSDDSFSLVQLLVLLLPQAWSLEHTVQKIFFKVIRVNDTVVRVDKDTKCIRKSRCWSFSILVTNGLRLSPILSGGTPSLLYQFRL